jgi:polar amino acid transport system permease protein
MIDGSDFGLQELILMLKGAGMTLTITFWAVLGGTLMGLAFGLVRAVAPWWINWRWAASSTSSAPCRS